MKPKLSEKILRDHNIYFDETVCGSNDLCDWMRPMQEQLTRLRGKLPRSAKPIFADELEIFRRSGQDSEQAFEDDWSLEPLDTEAETDYSKGRGFRKDPSIKEIENELRKCKEIAEEAIALRERSEREPSWMHLLVDHIFVKFYRVHGNSDSHE